MSARERARGWLFGAWSLLCLVVGLGAFEWALRAGWLPISFRTTSATFVLDSELLYRLKPGSRPDVDDAGHRVDPASRRAGAPRRVLLAGDSFAFGSNVAPHETLSARLEALLPADFAVVNLGVHGYGPDQSLLALRREFDRAAAELVVLTVFPANDFADLAKNLIFVPDGPGGGIRQSSENVLQRSTPKLWTAIPLALTWARVREVDWLAPLREAFFGDRYDTEFIIEPQSQNAREKILIMRGVLRATRDLVREAGAELLVVVLPSFQQFADPRFLLGRGVERERFFYSEELVEALCDAEGIAWLAVHRDFAERADAADLFDPVDHHLSPQGYGRVAGLIAGAVSLGSTSE